MPDVNIDVYCAKCGRGLCNQTSCENYKGNISFFVEPCEHCMQIEYVKGRGDSKDGEDSEEC